MSWEEDYEKAKNKKWAPTKLNESDELEFQKYLTGTQWFKDIKSKIEEREGIKVNDTILFSELAGPDSDYDYRGAWKRGIEPQKYEYDDGAYHWASMADDGTSLKAPNHDTLWMEYFMRETGQDPNSLGLHTEEDARAWSKARRGK